MSHSKLIALVCLALFAFGVTAHAADLPKGPIKVDVSSGEATQKADITGEEYVDYVFPAEVGQSLAVTLESNSKNCHFDLSGPQSETPFYISAITGDRYQQNVRNSGNHRVRVYLVRRAARKGESASYKISFRLSAAQ